MLTAIFAMPLSKDKKAGLAIRAEAIAAAKTMISEARATNANESGFPQTTDHDPDWMRIRNVGAGWGAGGNLWQGAWNGPGVLGYGWDAVSWPDGSVY